MRTNIHNGPAYRVDLLTERSIDGRTSLTFETTWPTARKPERLKRFQLHLNVEERERLIDAVQETITPSDE